MSDTENVENATPKAEAWRALFLAELRNSGNVRLACAAAKVDRRTAYRHKEQYKTFARAWDEALEEACDVLEAAARTRAMTTSDALLMFLLRAHRPGVYRETIRNEHSHSGAIETKSTMEHKLDAGNIADILGILAEAGVIAPALDAGHAAEDKQVHTAPTDE